MASAATPTAGGSQVSTVRKSAIPQFKFWRSLYKTFFYVPNNMSVAHGGIQHRYARTLFKMYIGGTVACFPAWLYNKYAHQKDSVAEQQTMDPLMLQRSPGQFHFSETRALTIHPQLVMGDDPWKYYVRAYNKLPWEQVTKFDKTDEIRGYNAWGDLVQPHFMDTKAQVHTRNNIMHHFYMSDYTSFAAYGSAKIFESFKMWTADVYYSWYHVYFHVPIDERLEGLGQPHGRRIMKRFFNNGGWGANKNLPPLGSGWGMITDQMTYQV